MNDNFLLSSNDIMNYQTTDTNNKNVKNDKDDNDDKEYISNRPHKYMKTNNINKLEKVNDTNFIIPLYKDYGLLHKKNYRVSFLKSICKHYKLKLSGNKPILTHRIYQHLHHSYFSIKLQRWWRRCLIIQFNKLFGPALYNRKICSNDTDFFTLDEIHEIPHYSFISYEAKDKTIWGFKLLSLYNLFKNKDSVLNPYTREKMGYDILVRLTKAIKLSKVVNITLELSLDDNIDLISYKKQSELRCLELFQYIDELGNYTDIKWFTSLKRWELVKFIRELVDIWEYRSELSNTMKRQICYPSGNPFRDINLNYLASLHGNALTRVALNVIHEFIKTGTSRDNQILGASYVLCGLTLVNTDAAIALPWLYQSVTPN